MLHENSMDKKCFFILCIMTYDNFREYFVLLFTCHCPARCFGMNTPKSRKLHAKSPSPRAIFIGFLPITVKSFRLFIQCGKRIIRCSTSSSKHTAFRYGISPAKQINFPQKYSPNSASYGLFPQCTRSCDMKIQLLQAVIASITVPTVISKTPTAPFFVSLS